MTAGAVQDIRYWLTEKGYAALVDADATGGTHTLIVQVPADQVIEIGEKPC